MTEKQRKQIELTFYMIGMGVLTILLGIWIFQKRTGISVWNYTTPCVFHTITGIYCPGCGGTRAVYALFQGRCMQSFLYHPLVVYTAIVGSWFLVSHTIEKLSFGKIKIGMHYRHAYLWIALALVVINVILKNLALFLGDTDIFTLINQL